MPHEAVEYVMAYSGEHFDPEVVKTFARQVPLYPTGVTVMLNSGEVGIVSDANTGHIARPIVRICVDARGWACSDPQDVDLSLAEYQSVVVVKVS